MRNSVAQVIRRVGFAYFHRRTIAVYGHGDLNEAGEPFRQGDAHAVVFRCRVLAIELLRSGIAGPEPSFAFFSADVVDPIFRGEGRNGDEPPIQLEPPSRFLNRNLPGSDQIGQGIGTIRTDLLSRREMLTDRGRG